VALIIGNDGEGFHYLVFLVLNPEQSEGSLSAFRVFNRREKQTLPLMNADNTDKH
jgi:hypothetical protein